MNLKEWKAAGEYVTIGKDRLFVMDQGEGPETIVILHGYPTASYDFKAVLPLLSKKFRVVVHDHTGFGLSDKPLDYSYSLMEQADRALVLWTKLGIREAHLVAHDYGTSVATEIIARRNMGFEPIRLHSLTLSNGSVHIEMAKLRIIQHLLLNKFTGPIVARLSSRKIFRKNMHKIWYDPSTLPEEEIDAMWELVTMNGGREVLPMITQYLRERRRFWDRWVGGLQKSDLKALILWGKHDPITGENVARVHHEEMPGSQLHIIETAGHYPTVETPDLWANALLKFLE